MDDNALFLLLELNDALFPIGAYTHSYGLETYVQDDSVHDRETAKLWLQAYLGGSFLANELLAVRFAYEAMEQENAVPKLQEIEQVLRAARVPRESREAMEKLGRRLAANVRKIQLPVDKRFFAYVEARKKNCAHPVCYGALTAALHLPKRQAMLHYLYAQLSAMINTCVKLIPLSQTDGACLLADYRHEYSQLIDRAMGAGEEDFCLAFPGLDIRSMQHETLYSRLYMS